MMTELPGKKLTMHLSGNDLNCFRLNDDVGEWAKRACAI